MQNEQDIQNYLLDDNNIKEMLNHKENEGKIKESQELFKEIIKLINNSSQYMLGPEKSITARFIVKNGRELNELLKRFSSNER